VNVLVGRPSQSCHKRGFSVTKMALNKKPVGFIGLGNMGGHMATNLVKAGFPLIIKDINPQAEKKLKEFSPKNIQIAVSLKELASQVESIITMLPSSPHVTKVFTESETGILSGLKPGTICIDTSTIDPNVSRDLSSLIAQSGSQFVDAPVSGGVVGAENATLTFMVGGSQEAFEKAKPLLQCMGKNITYCGGSGNGQVVKLCNNLVLAISMIATSEAMNLGVSLGMDPKLLASIFNTSSARCWSSDSYNPVPGIMQGVPSSRGYSGGFGVDLMLKDLGLAVDAAAKSKTPLLLGREAKGIYKLLSTNGYGSLDFSSVYQFLSDPKIKK